MKSDDKPKRQSRPLAALKPLPVRARTAEAVPPVRAAPAAVALPPARKPHLVVRRLAHTIALKRFAFVVSRKHVLQLLLPPSFLHLRLLIHQIVMLAFGVRIDLF